ncbi:MAG: succinate dehydrogenase, cytochrome b556 subunit [Chloroflexota bacterium]
MSIGPTWRLSAREMFGYQISWAQLAWMGHRLSGIGVIVFLFAHVVETATVALGPGVYDFTQGLYHNLPVRLGEIVLMAAVVYHSLNGLRVIVMDFWPRTTVYYRSLTYGVIAATVLAMIPIGLIMITPYAPWGRA